MAKRKYYLIVDTETSINDRVIDFGAVIVDRTGKIYNRCAVLIAGIFETEDLFYDYTSNSIFSKSRLEMRTNNYRKMVENGSRMLASVNAINRWLEKANGVYSPMLTAYNLAFDVSKCQNTGIDLNGFDTRFCLWHAAVGNICKSREYRSFVLQNHLFNTPTEIGNMTFKTNAEAVTGFLNGEMSTEPHTAIEDIIGYEIPILVKILSKKKWQDKVIPYNWRDFQVKDYYKVA